MIYVTSDIHGRFDCLKRLLCEVNFSSEDWLYIIGDVIDRNGNGGVDILTWLLYQPNVQLILGNHENFLLSNRWLFDQITDDSIAHLDAQHLSLLASWQANGGDVTIDALVKETTPALRQDILDYLLDCPLMETVTVGEKRYVLVHGGLGSYSKEKHFSEYTPHELLWERPTMDTRYDPDAYTVIVGHTPTFVYSPQYRNRMIKSEGGWWNIDTGAARRDGAPMLLCLDTLKEYYIEGDSILECSDEYRV